MKKNINTTLKKGLLVTTLVFISNTLLFADVTFSQVNLSSRNLDKSLLVDEENKLFYKGWARNINKTCSEVNVFFPNNIFVMQFVPSGKKVIGTYLLEKVKNSKKLKLTRKVTADNGLADCSSNNGNYINQSVSHFIKINGNKEILFANTMTEKFTWNLLNTINYSAQEVNIILHNFTQAFKVPQKPSGLFNNLTTKEELEARVNARLQQNKEREKRREDYYQKIVDTNYKRQKENTSASWKNNLPSEVLTSIGKEENRLSNIRLKQQENDRRIEKINDDYRQESYRTEAINNDYIQQSYVQEQINYDYNNGY